MTINTQKLREALEKIQDALQDSYQSAGLECCGHGYGECCGNPEPVWDAADQKIMDVLGPIQAMLSDALPLIDAQTARIEAQDIIAQSVAASLERHGVTEADDPGEAIDVLIADKDAEIERLRADRDSWAEQASARVRDWEDLWADRDRLRATLETIEAWEAPLVESRGEAVSMSVAYGSNGVRDYFRGVARAALSGESND